MFYSFVITVCCCSVVLASQNSKFDPDNSGTLKDDPAEQLFTRLFMKRRTEQLDAVKGLIAIESYEKQYKMVSTITEKVFSVIQGSRVALESSGYVPGSSSFPKDEKILDALANILENTALFGDILLRLPDVSHKILSSKHEWEVLLHWSLGFANQTRLLDKQTGKLMYLVSQELNITERDPNYINPYSRNHKIQEEQQNLEQTVVKKKRKKERKKGTTYVQWKFYGRTVTSVLPFFG